MATPKHIDANDQLTSAGLRRLAWDLTEAAKAAGAPIQARAAVTLKAILIWNTDSDKQVGRLNQRSSETANKFTNFANARIRRFIRESLAGPHFFECCKQTNGFHLQTCPAVCVTCGLYTINNAGNCSYCGFAADNQGMSADEIRSAFYGGNPLAFRATETDIEVLTGLLDEVCGRAESYAISCGRNRGAFLE